MRARRLSGHIRAVLIFFVLLHTLFWAYFLFLFFWGGYLTIQRIRDIDWRTYYHIAFVQSYDAHFVTVLWTFTLKNKNCARGFLKWEFLKQGFSKGGVICCCFFCCEGGRIHGGNFFRLGFTYWDGPIKIGGWIKGALKKIKKINKEW